MTRSYKSIVRLICGAAFVTALTPALAQSYRVIYAFQSGSDGARPAAGLVEVNGLLYGTTSGGGPYYPTCSSTGCGTVFSLDPSTGQKTILHTFQGTDGLEPTSDLVDFDGLLYGVTEFGGDDDGYGNGVLFSLDPTTGAYNVLHSFHNTREEFLRGAYPSGSLVKIGQNVYGTTRSGGAHRKGTVYKLDLNTGRYTVVHSFGDDDGSNPVCALLDAKGVLYGTTTTGGGAPGGGTIFALDPLNGTLKVLHRFQGGDDGSNPHAGLTISRGVLYGTTTGGGSYHAGTVFSLNPATGAELVLHSFGRPDDGQIPYAALVKVGNALKGTTTSGGKSREGGTVFSLNLITGSEEVRHYFHRDGDGRYPEAKLLSAGGVRYGTTLEGGSAICNYGCGTVFALTP